MLRIILTSCLFLALPAVSAQTHSPDSCIDLDAMEFYIRMNSAVMPVLIDTRSWGEFRKERIEGAILAEKPDSLFSICDSLDFDKPVFLYCEDGYRSSVACRMLLERGFRNVYNLFGGLQAWKLCSYELDRGKLPRKRRRP